MNAEIYIEQYRKSFEKLDRKFWNYEDGCVLRAMAAMHEATGDPCYRETMEIFLDRYVCKDG